VQARTTALRLLMCRRPADCSVCASSEDAIRDGGAVFDDRAQLLATDGFGHSRPAGVPRSVGLFARWARRSPLAASTSGQALPPGCSSRPSGRCVTRRHRGLLAFARPVFSSPGCSPDGTGPLGLLPRASHPQQAGPAGRTSRWGLTSNTDQELRLRHRWPPFREFTRNTRLRVALTRHRCATR